MVKTFTEKIEFSVFRTEELTLWNIIKSIFKNGNLSIDDKDFDDFCQGMKFTNRVGRVSIDLSTYTNILNSIMTMEKIDYDNMKLIYGKLLLMIGSRAEDLLFLNIIVKRLLKDFLYIKSSIYSTLDTGLVKIINNMSIKKNIITYIFDYLSKPTIIDKEKEKKLEIKEDFKEMEKKEIEIFTNIEGPLESIKDKRVSNKKFLKKNKIIKLTKSNENRNLIQPGIFSKESDILFNSMLIENQQKIKIQSIYIDENLDTGQKYVKDTEIEKIQKELDNITNREIKLEIKKRKNELYYYENKMKRLNLNYEAPNIDELYFQAALNQDDFLINYRNNLDRRFFNLDNKIKKIIKKRKNSYEKKERKKKKNRENKIEIEVDELLKNQPEFKFNENNFFYGNN